MKKVLMINNERAYLPEINAYEEYFASNEDFRFYDSSKLKEFDVKEFDVIWHFMGLDFKHIKNKLIVHEYNSLSTPPFAKLKNFIKKRYNIKPDLRIFLSNIVKDDFDFKDNVKYCMRDMGIHEKFFNIKEKKEYDFVYQGEITKARKIDLLLEKFKHDLKNQTILVIGKPADNIYKDYKDIENIKFTGKLGYIDVPKLASRAMYGINFIPDLYPYNHQTSTKLLEYCALGLKVLTISSYWTINFMNSSGANFYIINKSLNNFDMKKIENFEYMIPDVTDYKWNKTIKESGIYETLKRL